jgi:signal transduction histidine kinase
MGEMAGAETSVSTRPEASRARLGLAAAALASGIGGAWAYAQIGASGLDLFRDLAVGWAFAGAGLIADWRRPGNPTGRLMVAEGLTWFIGNLQGTEVPLLFAVGAWFEALNLAVFAHLVLSYPHGRLVGRQARWIVGAAYWTVIVGGLVRLTAFDPARDWSTTYLTCPTCGPNPLLVIHDETVFATIDYACRGIGVLLAVAVAAVMVLRWRRGSKGRRRVLLPGWLALAVATLLIGWQPMLLAIPDTPEPVTDAVVLLSDLSQATIPIAFLVGLLRMRLRRAAIGNLVIEIGARPTPRRLRDVLADVLGDPSLRLGLWAYDTGAYVDPEGRPLRVPATGGEDRAIFVDRQGGPSAVILHDDAMGDDLELATAVRATVRLCLENAYLRGAATPGVAAAAPGVAAPGVAVIEAADRDRRRLERSLHDGVQARMVFALMVVRRLSARLQRDPDSGVRENVRESLRESAAEADQAVRRALDDLRAVAGGSHPAASTRDGLRPAVVALAERAALPVVVTMESSRHPPLIEATAYLTICEALSNAARHARANAVTVSLERRSSPRDGDRLVVEVVDDGVGGADPVRGGGLRALADRLTAIGGALRVHSPAGGGTRIQAELPCE